MATEALEETLQQLGEVASEFLAKHREQKDEGIAIQEEMEALDRQQEKRAKRIVVRLRQASANILAFADDSGSSQEHEQPLEVHSNDDDDDDRDE